MKSILRLISRIVRLKSMRLAKERRRIVKTTPGADSEDLVNVLVYGTRLGLARLKPPCLNFTEPGSRECQKNFIVDVSLCSAVLKLPLLPFVCVIKLWHL